MESINRQYLEVKYDMQMLLKARAVQCLRHLFRSVVMDRRRKRSKTSRIS